jgi:hypothetical protein
MAKPAASTQAANIKSLTTIFPSFYETRKPPLIHRKPLVARLFPRVHRMC